MIPWTNHLDTHFLILKTLGWLNSYQVNCAKYCECNVHIYDATIFINFPKIWKRRLHWWLGISATFFQIAAFSQILAAQTIFIFLWTWNNFLTWLLCLIQKCLLLLGLNTFKGQYISYWNYIMAASMIFTLPSLAIYAFFQSLFYSRVVYW